MTGLYTAAQVRDAERDGRRDALRPAAAVVDGLGGGAADDQAAHRVAHQDQALDRLGPLLDELLVTPPFADSAFDVVTAAA